MHATGEHTIRADERTLILLLAFVHLYHGAPQKAETLYAALVALDPDDAEAAKGLACALLDLRKAKAALDVLDGVTGPAEPSALVQLLRARAFVQLDHIEDAQVAMRAFTVQRGQPGRASDARRATPGEL